MATYLAQINNPAVPKLHLANQDDSAGLFGTFLGSLVGLFLVVATIWAFIQLLLGGLQWISSGGDKGNVEAARNKITHALIGLVLVFSFWAIYLVVLQYLGIITGDGLIFTLPTLF